MTMTLSGDGAITGLAVGGLPDATITQADLDTATSFAGTKTANGYQKLPNGLVLQWGIVTSAANPTGITFPVAFSTAVLGITFGNTSGVNVTTNAVAVTTSGFNFNSFAPPTGAFAAVTSYWFALGY